MSTTACAGSLRGYSVNAATCAKSNMPIHCTSDPPRLQMPPSAISSCSRNIYLDMGANWCNTMRLFETVPEVIADQKVTQPWHVFAIEAAPLISPYVERCVAALAAGKPLPPPPVPPAGSSMQLLNYASDLGCISDAVGRGRRERMNCVARALQKPLEDLARSINPALTANPALLKTRLAGARTRGGCAGGGDGGAGAAMDGGGRSGGVSTANGGTFEMLPAAAGASEGVLRMAGSPLQMLRGGSTAAGSNHQPQFDVPKVDVVRWMEESFREEDYVVLKMDVEGAEMEILPKLLATNATRLVDVFLWECHAKWKGTRGKCQCAVWEESLRRAGVRRVYREPYRFAPAEKFRAATWRSYSNATVA